MTYCSFVVIEVAGLAHWVGYNCEAESWQALCTGEKLTHGPIRDMPTLPVCGVCLMVSLEEVPA